MNPLNARRLPVLIAYLSTLDNKGHVYTPDPGMGRAIRDALCALKIPCDYTVTESGDDIKLKED